MPCCRFVCPAVRIEGVLENAAHQHLFITGKAVFGAVAVVYIEIDDGNPLKTMHFQRVAGSDADVVEEAETHRGFLLAMMAGGPHGTEGVFTLAAHYQIDCQTTRTGGTQGCLPGVRIHRRVGIEVHDTQFRRGPLDALKV